MISVVIKNDSVCVTGHAKQNEAGKDIVCASVSTAIYVSLNLLEKLNVKANYKLDEGYFLIERNENEIVSAVIENLQYTFKDLERQFPKYIKIKL